MRSPQARSPDLPAHPTLLENEMQRQSITSHHFRPLCPFRTLPNASPSRVAGGVSSRTCPRRSWESATYTSTPQTSWPRRCPVRICSLNPASRRACLGTIFGSKLPLRSRTAIRMDDGTEFTASPGDVTVLPSGHDAWVVGDEPVVVVDWFGAGNYAK